MKNKRVFPDDDRQKNRAHGQNVVGLKPLEVVWVQRGLYPNTQIDKIAIIKHEELELLRGIIDETMNP